MNLVFCALVLLLNCFPLISGQESPQSCPPDEEPSTLRAIFVLLRHGIRAPWTTYPLDPFANDTTRFPNGGSQLTDAGIEQAYNMGKFLKRRYKKILKGNQKRAYLRASAAQRCIDTLSIVAKEIWSPDDYNEKQWQPMIFSLPKQIDSVLYEEPDCEKAEEAEHDNLKTPEVQAYEADPKIQALYNFTAEKSGLEPNMYSVTKLFDCIRCEKLNKLRSPDWVTPEIYDQLGDVLSKRLNFFYSSKKAQRLRAGPILDDFKTQMDKVINGKSGEKPKNIFLYTTHDFKIAAVLNALGDPQPKYPPFAAAIIFELHRIGDKNVVKAFYVNQTVDWPFTAIDLPLTNCKKLATGGEDPSLVARVAQDIKKEVEQRAPKLTQALSSLPRPSLPTVLTPKPSPDTVQECTFEKFVDSNADLTPVDWRTECGLDCQYDPFKSAENNLGKT